MTPTLVADQAALVGMAGVGGMAGAIPGGAATVSTTIPVGSNPWWWRSPPTARTAP